MHERLFVGIGRSAAILLTQRRKLYLALVIVAGLSHSDRTSTALTPLLDGSEESPESLLAGFFSLPFAFPFRLPLPSPIPLPSTPPSFCSCCLFPLPNQTAFIRTHPVSLSLSGRFKCRSLCAITHSPDFSLATLATANESRHLLAQLPWHHRCLTVNFVSAKVHPCVHVTCEKLSFLHQA